MPEYDIDLAESLALIATEIVNGGIKVRSPGKTALYTSLLSIELSLKAMLEQAGFPVKKIVKCNHDLQCLMNELGRCKVQPIGSTGFISASYLRSKTVHLGDVKITVGELIDKSTEKTASNRSENTGPRPMASIYPNEIRYGNDLNHYAPAVVAMMAVTVCAFAKEHWQGLITV